ncbi:MAG: hypothetical protein WA884_18470 [Methyloceanibacter sp.]
MITLEIDGVCVGWWQRRTAEGVPVFQHGGSWGGQNSDFFLVPEREFAMTTLTNSTNGSRLIAELGRSGWALTQFAGLSNPPAIPQTLPPAQLAPYEGRYRGWVIPPDGRPDEIVEQVIELSAADGGLHVRGDLELSLSPSTATISCSRPIPKVRSSGAILCAAQTVALLGSAMEFGSTPIKVEAPPGLVACGFICMRDEVFIGLLQVGGARPRSAGLGVRLWHFRDIRGHGRQVWITLQSGR